MSARDDLLAIPDELLRAGEVAEVALVHMDFATGAKRWWTGVGDLPQGGHIWQGTGDLIDLGILTTSYQVNAAPVDFQVAATPEMIALAQNAAAAVRGRDVTVWTLLFSTVTMQPIASPIALFAGQMWRLTYEAEGSTSRLITLHAEGLFARRNKPPRGLWTDRDQQARHPGDKGMERMPIYENYETRWV